MTAFVLTMLGAMLAVALELLEALAIVLAVGVSRRWRDALIGTGAAVVACAAIAVLVGPVCLRRLPCNRCGSSWACSCCCSGSSGCARACCGWPAAGRAPRSAPEYDETREELAGDPPPPPGQPDWAARIVAFKGVLLEGIEVVLIVSALAARPGGLAPALAGTALACVLVVGLGAWLRRPLSRLPETELKFGVGVVLTSFGTFFCAEGLGVDWPGGDPRCSTWPWSWPAWPRCRSRRFPTDGEGQRMSVLRELRKLVLGETSCRWASPRCWWRRSCCVRSLRHGWCDAGGFILLAPRRRGCSRRRWRPRTGGAERLGIQ